MTGPCMCGDPYCVHCGDPAREDWEAAMDQLQDDIDGKKMSNLELELFKNVGFAAVDAFRKASQDIVAEVSTNYGQQIDLLEVDSALLKDQLDSATKQLQEVQDKLRRVQESVGTERSNTDA